MGGMKRRHGNSPLSTDAAGAMSLVLWCLVLVFFINPIVASEIDRGVSSSKLGPTHPQHPSPRGASLTSVAGSTGPALPLYDAYS